MNNKSVETIEPKLIEIGGTPFDVTDHGVLDFSLDDPSDDQATATDIE